MVQIVIKTEDTEHGVQIKTFSTRAEVDAYLDSIGLGAAEKPAKVEEKKSVAKPVAKSKPVAKKAKKR